MMKTEEPRLSVKQLADRWGLTEGAIRKMLHERRVESIRIGGRVRFDPDYIRTYEQEHTRPARKRGEFSGGILEG